jgi:hypothetical protein
MAFKASESTSDLKWDFRPFVDAFGETPEPSSDQISDYWASELARMRESQRRAEEFNSQLDDLTKAKDEDGIRALHDKYDSESIALGKSNLDERRHVLSQLCSDCPNYDQINALPGRIFEAFEFEMQQSLGPKARRTDTSD